MKFHNHPIDELCTAAPFFKMIPEMNCGMNIDIMSNMKKVFAYTDGSALGNPGPGGYGSILRFTSEEGVTYESKLSQGFNKTTNNRMEIMGVIAVLEALNQPCELVVTTDSQYVANAFNQNWIAGWQAKNWKKADGKKVKNIDLWKRILELSKKHSITFEWVKGHDGHPENEKCDELAKNAATSLDLIDDIGFLSSNDNDFMF